MTIVSLFYWYLMHIEKKYCVDLLATPKIIKALVRKPISARQTAYDKYTSNSKDEKVSRKMLSLNRGIILFIISLLEVKSEVFFKVANTKISLATSVFTASTEQECALLCLLHQCSAFRYNKPIRQLNFRIYIKSICQK